MLGVVAAEFLYSCYKFLDILAGAFHLPPAFQIRLPRRGQGQRFRRILVEGLSHHRDQIGDHACVLEQRLDDRVRQLDLIRFSIGRAIGDVCLLIRHVDSLFRVKLPPSWDFIWTRRSRPARDEMFIAHRVEIIS